MDPLGEGGLGHLQGPAEDFFFKGVHFGARARAKIPNYGCGFQVSQKTQGLRTWEGFWQTILGPGEKLLLGTGVNRVGPLFKGEVNTWAWGYTGGQKKGAQAGGDIKKGRTGEMFVNAGGW